MKVVPVILAGGIGERFWPASSSSKPKQLLPLISDKLMIEETFERVLPLLGDGVKPLIVTGSKIAKLTEDAIDSSYTFDIIAEPVGKNTAPAVGAAAAFCKEKYGDDSVMVVVSADHSIRPIEKFIAAASYAVEIAAKEDTLVVFGIKPTRPDTGYGYVELSGDKGESKDSVKSFSVKRFVEKPNLETAKVYFKSGNYLWNSGMFIWKTSTILAQFEKQMPELYSDIRTLIDNGCTIENINTFYNDCLKESIDFGIMERADSVSAVEGIFEWDDIGSWEAIRRINGTDENGTTTSGKAIYSAENKNSTIVNMGDNPIAVIGAENMLVVNVNGTTLVISRDKLNDFKKYLGEIKNNDEFPQELF